MNKLGKILLHIVIVVAALGVLLVLPFVRTDTFQNWWNRTDGNSSASVIIDQPSGEYVVYINREFHRNTDNLEQWVKFFQGEDITYIFEDISCSVADGDTGAVETAKSFQSRLPENQMKVEQVDSNLLFSRGDHMKFDIMIVSKELEENYGFQAPAEDQAQRIVITRVEDAK